jgi:glycerol-3-phosphate dehydrogenase
MWTKRFTFIKPVIAVSVFSIAYFNLPDNINSSMAIFAENEAMRKRKSRQEMISRLKGSAPDSEFDLLVVGGGATGVGCALDAASRGLKVALVERDDFASGNQCLLYIGTSSKSTKLVHGGIRYLEKAFWEMDMDQYNLVREALHERGVFLNISPYLSKELPIMIPIYE